MNLERKIERTILKKYSRTDSKSKPFNEKWKGWKEFKKNKIKEGNRNEK